VVPYNPYLLRKYQCHINVEVCNTVAAVKYLYKYVYKGHDRAEVSVRRVVPSTSTEAGTTDDLRDEINEYVDGRYISASEAACRIFGFDLHEITPSVHRLPVHLPGQQTVFFQEGDDPAAVLARASDTKLTSWFAFNAAVAAQHAADDPSGPLPPALTTIYPDIAKLAVWDKHSKKWKARQLAPPRGRLPVGRMYHVSPSDRERFYLRMLLLIVPGATCFEDVRTTGEGPSAVVHETFKAACFARGLLQDDGEWRQAMEEARVVSTPKALRMMFVSLLLYVEVEDPLDLWNRFRDDMTEDFLHEARATNPTQAYHDGLYGLALADIQRMLSETNKTLADYRLPLLQNVPTFGAVEEELALYDVNRQQEAVAHMLPMLNEDQRAAYDELLSAVDTSPMRRDCNVYFLDGVGGSGKTTLYNTILQKVRSMGKIAIAVASSGIAALLLEGGKTAHSRFKIPVGGLDADSTCFITQQSPLAELIRHASLIVWDEAGMVHRHAVEAVDRSLRDVLGRDNPTLRQKPFGGIVTLLGGDFRQILPVVKHGGRADTVAACINRSHLWPRIRLLKLRVNMRVRRLLNSGEENAVARAQHLQAFADTLLRVGDGTEDVHPAYGADCIRIPAAMCCQDHTVEGLLDRVYGDVSQLSTAEERAEYFTSRVVLAPRNEDVDAINKMMHDRLQGADAGMVGREYLSADSIDDDSSHFPVEFLNSLNISGVPPHRLHLQLGCPVVLLRNLSFGLANGTRMVVTQLMDHCIQVQVVTGPLRGNKVLLPRLTITPSDAEDYPFTLRRRQFPVRPAYAMTINKAQGQTFKMVGLYLPRHVFSHGQLYVALSRAGEPEAVIVAAPDAFKDDDGNVYVRNVVYKDALLPV